MNKQAILHIQDSSYCFPVSQNEMVLRVRTACDDIDFVKIVYESKYVIGRSQKSADMEKAYSDGVFDWYEITLKLDDTRLAYVFKIGAGDESFWFSEDGLAETYDFKLGYYNFFQYPYINEADIVRPVEWMKNAVFYQIFVERFNRGIADKDDSYINMRWGDKPTPTSFAGGDIPGITAKLDYLKELGISALYLTPVFKSISNHKYDISDYYEVDPAFGSNHDLKTMVEECHKRGIRVVLDAVFNHVSERLAQFRDVKEKGRNSEFFDWFVIYGDSVDLKNCNYETFADCRYMPKLNTSNKCVQDFLTGIAVHYITEYDIDGWRLDVSDEISQDYWRTFRRAVKAAKSDAVIIGENWHDAYRNLRGDQYDSIMNYAFTKAALDYFANGSKDALATARKLNELLIRNKDGVNRMMLNLLDSHDTHRFFTCVNENRAVVKEALAMLFFYMGTPCIYYGTEILMPGGYDPDCRRCMDWDKVLPGRGYDDVIELIRDLAAFRHDERVDEGVYRIGSEQNVLRITSAVDPGLKYALYINHSAQKKCIDGIAIGPEGFVITKNGGVLIHE